MPQSVSGAKEYVVAEDNCGVPGEQSHLVVGSGAVYTYSGGAVPLSVIGENDPLRTILYSGGKISFVYGGLLPKADYSFRMSSKHNMVPHLGIICFLCYSCLSVSRVPQYSTM